MKYDDYEELMKAMIFELEDLSDSLDRADKRNINLIKEYLDREEPVPQDLQDSLAKIVERVINDQM